MNRRSILIGLLLPSTTAGCLFDDEEYTPNTSDGDDEFDGHSCPARGNLAITFVPESPDDEPIVDAEEEQFADIEYLAKALSEASDEYDKLAKKELNESKRLAEFRGEEIANNSSKIISKIGYGEGTYVEYENVVYSMIYVEMVC